MNVGPNGQVFTIQVHNGKHPDSPDALIEYKCHICGEAGTSFGMPLHFREKALELDSGSFFGLRGAYPRDLAPFPEYECAAREIEKRSGFRFEVQERRKLAQEARAMSKILYVPEPKHQHVVKDLQYGGFPIVGTVAVCDGCGKVLVYEGSSSGMVTWWEEGWFHRWNRLRRERKVANAQRKERIEKIERTIY